jgi:hypothetical protein
VQLRLSVVSLASSKFESPERVGAPVYKREDLFEERRGGTSRKCRIGVAQADLGGWYFTSWFGWNGKQKNKYKQPIMSQGGDPVAHPPHAGPVDAVGENLLVLARGRGVEDPQSRVDKGRDLGVREGQEGVLQCRPAGVEVGEEFGLVGQPVEAKVKGQRVLGPTLGA